MDPQAPSEKRRVQAHHDKLERKPLPPTLPSAHSPGSLPGSPAGSPAQGYRGADASASRNQDFTRPPTPPPYSGPSCSSQVSLGPRTQQPRGPQKYPGLPRLDYGLYSPPLFDLSPDCTTIRSSAPYLSSSVTALADLVRSQSTVPPKPQVHITGQRGRRVDFAVRLNLMTLLVPDDPRQRMDYIRCVGEGEMALRGGAKPALEPHIGDDAGLEEWCRRFVEDPAPVKQFVLERVVANLDTGWLEGQIRSLVASTDYRGVVTVKFPVTHARVVVSNKADNFLTGITTLFAGKRKYEVVKAVWPFATHSKDEAGRRCLVQSEDQWWREWQQSIKNAISEKRKGWVTNEDKLEAVMEGKGNGLVIVDWGPEVRDPPF